LKNFLENLGLCKKAGALEIGFDAAVEAAAKGRASGILTASDISEKTLKEVNFHARKHKAEVLQLPARMAELKAVIGKSAGVIAVTDEGLLSLFKNKDIQ